MEDRIDWPALRDKLAIMACEISGLNPYHEKDGKRLFEHKMAQSKAKKALEVLKLRVGEEIF